MTEHQTSMFVASTFGPLSEDIARGGREHLAALTTLMGVPVEHRTAFFAMAQQHYRGFVEAGETSSVALIKASSRCDEWTACLCPSVGSAVTQCSSKCLLYVDLTSPAVVGVQTLLLTPTRSGMRCAKFVLDLAEKEQNH